MNNMDRSAANDEPKTRSNLTLSDLRRAATYLGASFRPSGFNSLELVKKNEVVWGTLEQGTQRGKVQPVHFTEIVEAEVEKTDLQ